MHAAANSSPSPLASEGGKGRAYPRAEGSDATKFISQVTESDRNKTLLNPNAPHAWKGAEGAFQINSADTINSGSGGRLPNVDQTLLPRQLIAPSRSCLPTSYAYMTTP